MSWARFAAARRTGQQKKIGNTQSVCALGHSHRSKLEVSVCCILQLREKAGEITIDQVEDYLPICGPPEHKCKRQITYIADFRCTDLKNKQSFWVEAKGFANDRWPMKKNLYRHYGPGPLEIWMGGHSAPYLAETIIPD